MGFLTGSVTFLRFRVNGPAPLLFDQDHIDRLADRAVGRQRIAAADGVEVGWTAGDHIHDTDFRLDKNVVNDSLHFDLAVESDKLPADKLKAYYQIELKALTANNPSGFPSSRQKREAKEAARARLEEEAKDGRYRKRKCVPVMWDRTTGEVLFGSTSLTHADRMCVGFEQTFGVRLEAVTAGRLACDIIGDGLTNGETRPARLLDDVSYTADYAWIAHEDNHDWLGNEFMLWLWYWLDVNSDTLTLQDASEATVMIARTLVLDCPRGQSGTDGFRHEGPTRLPEARRAIQAGKLPRRCGLTVVRHDQQYEFTLHAETMAVGAAKMPPPPEDVTDARGKIEERVGQIREFVETLDGLFGAFLARRLGREWAVDLPAIQAWLARRDRVTEAA
jgi:hypothetical protein